LIAKLTSKKFSLSGVRVKKFCTTTQFDSTADSVPEPVEGKAPFTLSEGLHRTLHYEFIDLEKDEVVFESE